MQRSHGILKLRGCGRRVVKAIERLFSGHDDKSKSPTNVMFPGPPIVAPDETSGQARVVTLLAAKSDFPKCLYLDTNKWIDLGRAHYDRDGGVPFKDALAAVEAAVASGRLVVPMSGVHVMEAMAPRDEGRRQRLAEFMVKVSKNSTMLPHMSIRGLEILQAVLRKLGLRTTTSIRTAMVTQGLSFALGGEPTISAPEPLRAELLALVNSPATSVRLLVEAGDRSLIQATVDEDKAAAAVLEETRRRAHAVMTDEMRHRVELAELFSKGEPSKEIASALRQLGIPAATFAKLFSSPEEWIAFFHDVPTVDVFVTLSLERDKDFNRPIHRNDLKDIAFMSVAVPYANMIVAEKFWSSIVERTGLAKKHNTTVLTDARELPSLLAREGCL